MKKLTYQIVGENYYKMLIIRGYISDVKNVIESITKQVSFYFDNWLWDCLDLDREEEDHGSLEIFSSRIRRPDNMAKYNLSHHHHQDVQLWVFGHD